MAPTTDADLSPSERSRALIVLCVVLAMLLGSGLVLDRVTTRVRSIPFSGIPRAVPFPRDVVASLQERARAGGGLGRARTGQTWNDVAGVWALGDDGARLVTPAPTGSNYALIRTSRGPGSVQLTATTITKGMGLAFRCKTPLDCWTVTAVPEFGTWKITKTVGGNATEMGNVGTVPVGSGTRVRVDDTPESFEISVNDEFAVRIEDPELNDAPRSGLVVEAAADATGARFLDFEGRQPNIVGPGAPVRDAFDRANGSRLGQTPTGQRWVANSGEWRIRDREAVLETEPSLDQSIVTMDIGRSTGWVQVTGSVVTPGWGVAFRYRDDANYWRITAVPQFGTFNIFRVVGGIETRVGSTQLTSFGHGSTVGLRIQRQDFTVFVDGVETVTINDDRLGAETRAGLVIDSPDARGARFAGFAAGPLDLAGVTP